MVLGTFFKSVTSTDSSLLSEFGGFPDKRMTYINHNDLPMLRTFAAAPDQVDSNELRVLYDPARYALTLRFSHGDEYVFIFRERHVMVLSDEHFTTDEFLEKLHASLR